MTNKKQTHILSEGYDYANSEGVKLMNEMSEKIHGSNHTQSEKALKEYSKEQLMKAVKEFDSQWEFLDYITDYEKEYWLNFTADLIEDGKIEADYWAKKMPQSDPYPELIRVLLKRIKLKHLNLSEKELASAVYNAKLGKLAVTESDILDLIQSDQDKVAELNKLLAVSYPDITAKVNSPEAGTDIAKNLRAMLKSKTPEVVQELRRTTQREVTE